MKKIISAALAGALVLSMGVTAFAASNDGADALYINPDGTLASATANEGKVSRGFAEYQYHLYTTKTAGTPDTLSNEADSNDVSDYKLVVKVTEGKEYFKSAVIDELDYDHPTAAGTADYTNGQYGIIVKLKDFYDVSSATVKLELKITKKAGGTIMEKTNVTIKMNNKTADYVYSVENSTDTNLTGITNAADIKAGLNYKSNLDVLINLTKLNGDDFKNATNAPTTGGGDIGFGLKINKARVIDFKKAEYIELDADGFNYNVKASNQGKLSIAYNNKAIKAVSAKAPVDADLNFFNFPGAPAFDFTGTVSITLPDEDVEYFIYESTDDGILSEIPGAKLNEDGDAIEFKARTLTNYVLSDVELETGAEEDVTPAEEAPAATEPTDEKTNPGTGVGALVALVF